MVLGWSILSILYVLNQHCFTDCCFTVLYSKIAYAWSVLIDSCWVHCPTRSARLCVTGVSCTDFEICLGTLPIPWFDRDCEVAHLKDWLLWPVQDPVCCFLHLSLFLGMDCGDFPPSLLKYAWKCFTFCQVCIFLCSTLSIWPFMRNYVFSYNNHVNSFLYPVCRLIQRASS